MPDKKKHSAKPDARELRQPEPSAINSAAPEQSIGSRIKAKREELGLNFEQFAALTRADDAQGIAAVTLRRYEREGDRATLPGLRELRILCEALDVTADYLLRGDSTSEYQRRDKEDWEMLKAIMARAVKQDGLPGIDVPDANASYFRQEKLRLARLHTKKKNE